jgi:hypothetical protein
MITPIHKSEKNALYRVMHERFRERRGDLVAAFDRAKITYEIHHRVPLERAHMFPELDINAMSNLFALQRDVHKAINIVWTRFRTVPSSHVTRGHVEQVAAIVDRHFRRWYNEVPATSASFQQAVQTARQKALQEVDALIAAARGAR